MKKFLTILVFVLCFGAYAQSDYVDSAGNVFNNWRLDGYTAWNMMTVEERHSYTTGVMVGSYSFGLRYALDPRVVKLKEAVPSVGPALIIEYTNSDLVNLVNRVYAIPKFRTLKLPEILCWPEVWIQRLSEGGA
jgi:hypothetical protein